MRWLLALPRRLSQAVLHLLQDTTGVRPLDTGELRRLNELLEDQER